MNTEGFLLDIFDTTDKVTVNAKELQKLIQNKRALECKVTNQGEIINTLNSTLTNHKIKERELYTKLQKVESKLNDMTALYTVDLKA